MSLLKKFRQDKKNYLIDLLKKAKEDNITSEENLADYLLENGVEVHYMKEFSKIFRINEEDICTDVEGKYNECDRIYENPGCEYCKYYKKRFVIEPGLYSFTRDDYSFGNTVFKTFEEAEEGLKKVIAEYEENKADKAEENIDEK